DAIFCGDCAGDELAGAIANMDNIGAVEGLSNVSHVSQLVKNRFRKLIQRFHFIKWQRLISPSYRFQVNGVGRVRSSSSGFRSSVFTSQTRANAEHGQ